MGFKNKRLYRLKFADDDMAGLEVRVRSMSTGDLQRAIRLTNLGENLQNMQEELGDLFALLEKGLVDWNLEDDDDEPVPTTVAGINDTGFEIVMAIVMAWIDAVVGVPAPLGPRSPNGVPSPEASIPMEPLSGNQPS